MNDYKEKSILSALALALVALAWGTSYAIIKNALSSIGPFQLMTLRFGLSTVILAVAFGKRLKNISRKNIYRSALIGLFMFLAFLTLVTGISYTTASKQSFLVGSYVLIVPFLVWIIMRKRPDMYSIAGAILATCGIGLLTLNNGLHINRGDSISILSSLFFACHMIAIEYFRSELDPIASTIIQFAVTSIMFIILWGTFESFKLSVSTGTLASVGYLVIVATVIAFAVQNVAQRYISSTSTSLILTLESAFGSIFAVMLLNEVMTGKMIIGSIIIFTGILIQQVGRDFMNGIFNKQYSSKKVE